jgi:hypothetical protein
MEQVKNKNRLSFNLKAKKNCDAIGMILHCENAKARLKSDNITYPENTKLNISSPNIFSQYEKLTNDVETIKSKKIQKNANHYLEGVLAFPEHLVNEMGIEKFREEAPRLIEKYMEEIKDAYGFEPCGFSLHFDEGHKADKEGNVKDGLNIHAHLSFVNYDFKQNKARFREIQQKYVSKRKVPNMAFVAMQDLAGQVFEPLGFKRGISKAITGKVHLDKEGFVTEKLADREKELAIKEIELEEKNTEICKVKGNLAVANGHLKRNLDDHHILTKKIIDLKTEQIDLEASNKTLRTKMQLWFKSGLKYIKRSLEGFKAELEANETLDNEPELPEKELNEFYSMIEDNSGNDTIQKQRKKRRPSGP